MYDGTLTQIEEKSLIQGTVIAITKKEVVIANIIDFLETSEQITIQFLSAEIITVSLY